MILEGLPGVMTARPGVAGVVQTRVIPGLKEIGAQNHLLLRGNKSLASRSRHQLRAPGRKIGLAGEELTLMRGLGLMFY
jgi:hypothetical protein